MMAVPTGRSQKRAIYTKGFIGGASVRMRKSVAFLGPNGSYTHQAAIQYAKSQNDASLIPQVTIKDVFDAVLGGAVTHGIVPIENSTNGSVTITFDLFRDLKHGNLKVCGEQFVRVQHALLGQCPLDKIERLYSHPQVVPPNLLMRPLDSVKRG
jgi:prephenate dehydratase